jgi:hypothetical protein
MKPDVHLRDDLKYFPVLNYFPRQEDVRRKEESFAVFLISALDGGA